VPRHNGCDLPGHSKAAGCDAKLPISSSCQRRRAGTRAIPDLDSVMHDFSATTWEPNDDNENVIRIPNKANGRDSVSKRLCAESNAGDESRHDKTEFG
jgi:hypothetical protein